MTQQAKGKRAQKKQRKEDGQRREGEADHSRRVSALLMGSVHRPSELAAKLRERFGAGAVRQLSTHEGSPIVHGDALLLLPAADTEAQGIVSDVLYLCIPANDAREPPTDISSIPPPPAAAQSGSSVRVFFFTGSGSSRGEALGESGGWGMGATAGGIGFGGSGLSGRLGGALSGLLGGKLTGGLGGVAGFAQFERLCVSVWWGASPALEERILRDLRAGAARQLPRQQVLERLVSGLPFLYGWGKTCLTSLLSFPQPFSPRQHMLPTPLVATRFSRFRPFV